MSYWSVETLRTREAEVGARAFARGYRQKPYASDELLFPSFAPKRNYLYNEDWRLVSAEFLTEDESGNLVPDPYAKEGVDNEEYNPGSPVYVSPAWPRFIGVDLSSKKRAGNVIFVIALDYTTDTMHALEILSGEWTSPETAQWLSDATQRHRPDMVFVENNGYQNAIIEWMKSAGLAGWTKVESYTTLNQKFDPDIGLPSLDVRFAQSQFKIAIPHAKSEIADPDPRDPTRCVCTRCRFIRDISVTTREDSTPDTVMACWIAKEASRAGVRFVSPVRVVSVTPTTIRQAAAAKLIDDSSGRGSISPTKAAMNGMRQGPRTTKDFGRVLTLSDDDKRQRDTRNQVDAAKLVRILNDARQGGQIDWQALSEAEAYELDRMLEQKAAIYEAQANPEMSQLLTQSRRTFRALAEL